MTDFERALTMSAAVDVKRHRAWASMNMRIEESVPLSAGRLAATKIAVVAAFALLMISGPPL